ncbi:MAG TPA: NUDIX hydrolase [Lachnospiraceae bacterium]|nr:NUDIX hydrolase [Lachnospiraceae bacterium]MCR4785684.1 NUDIX hydrolase [Lachnospiraceae bacterium]HAL31599.1 NUDIX hydrolase [Lachnospiraceae bacterium]HBB58888.1 NUDIX hydrolase [Lachnospiraceae bacterium]HCR99189.1 NUDIX hydrolase [Lachnospiraceae bacterium]
MIRRFRQLSREVVDTNVIFQYCKDQVELPDGQVEEYVACVHKGASAVVPVLPDGRILMVHQYRYAIDRETIEIPAGGRNGTEEPFETAAKRELEEETGYTTDSSLEHLITIATAIAYCNEIIEVYVAKDLRKTSQHLDPDEYIDVEAFVVEDLVDMIYSGRIQDSKTIASIMAYHNRISSGKL